MSAGERYEVGEAVEVLVVRGGRSRTTLLCEHASMRLPEPWTWPDEDHWVVGTHWSWDPGAAEITRELADALGAAAVLSRFTRLLCDPNRAESDPDLFRAVAEGRRLALNQDLGQAERERRLATYHRAYHAAADRLIADHPGTAVLSVHTFTPLYEGSPRDVEIGVLFDDEDDLATDLAVAISDRGYPVWLNEPWSGKDGLIYSADRHGKAHGRRVLELEVRNDLATDPAWRAAFVPHLRDALAELDLA